MKINPLQLNTIQPLRPGANSAEQQIADAKEVRDTFRTFIGESFFGQMLKSMRTTLDKPSYFHGGHAEEVFQGQMDQAMSEEMTKASADKIADPMFRQQFPQQAEVLRQAAENTKSSLADLGRLRRL